MGTHPIFESDFDCLTELVSGNMNTENKENVSQMNSQEDKGSPNLKTDEVKNKIDAALALGKRAIIGKDYQGALSPLSECCELISLNYGEMDERLAEPAFEYGYCLFEISRAQMGVFGSEIEEKVEVKDTGDSASDPILENEPKKEDTSGVSKTEEKPSEKSRESESEEEAEEGADDDSQLAYEWLETARVLYSKQSGKDAKLKEAEAL